MLAYIKGIVIDVETDSIVVENHGIGYEIFVPSPMDYMNQIQQEVKVFTYLYVREDAMVLYGFASKQKISIFKYLLSVSGVGPKAALSILSGLSAQDIYFAIISEDTKTLCAANGIGKKTASRIILELKEKIQKLYEPETVNTSEMFNSKEDGVTETVDALVALGYSKSEVMQAVYQVEKYDELRVEELVKRTLKKLSTL